MAASSTSSCASEAVDACLAVQRHERPPVLSDFPDRAAGERARDVFHQAWYGRPLLPAYDEDAESGPGTTHASREAAWKRLLWSFRDRHRDAGEEAARKRRERRATRVLADSGDAVAISRMDDEAARGRRRREVARVKAQELLDRVRVHRDGRAQRAERASAASTLLRKVQRVALDATASSLPPPEYAQDLCRARWAQEHPSDCWAGSETRFPRPEYLSLDAFRAAVPAPYRIAFEHPPPTPCVVQTPCTICGAGKQLWGGLTTADYSREDAKLRKAGRPALKWGPRDGWLGHTAECCHLPRQQALSMYGAIYCTLCHRPGHLFRACPQRASPYANAAGTRASNCYEGCWVPWRWSAAVGCRSDLEVVDLPKVRVRVLGPRPPVCVCPSGVCVCGL